MNSSTLAQNITKLARLERLKRSLTGRTRYLLSRCEIVLSGSDIEIFAPDYIIFWRLLSRIEAFNTRAEKIGADRIILNAPGLYPYHSR